MPCCKEKVAGPLSRSISRSNDPILKKIVYCFLLKYAWNICHRTFYYNFKWNVYLNNLQVNTQPSPSSSPIFPVLYIWLLLPIFFHDALCGLVYLFDVFLIFAIEIVDVSLQLTNFECPIETFPSTPILWILFEYISCKNKIPKIIITLNDCS